jgi:hypothetical protein
VVQSPEALAVVGVDADVAAGADHEAAAGADHEVAAGIDPEGAIGGPGVRTVASLRSVRPTMKPAVPRASRRSGIARLRPPSAGDGR